MNTIATTPVASPRKALGSLSEKVASFSDHLRAERAAREIQQEHHRAEQRNASNTTHVRIAAWEKLHGLRLPSEPEHPVLFAIANHTRLSIAQIREEQAARAALGAPRLLPGEWDVYGRG
jgi:hypothetical protein